MERRADPFGQSSKEQGPRHGYKLDHQKTGDYGMFHGIRRQSMEEFHPF